MHKGYKAVRELIQHAPLQLLKLKEPKLIAYANSLWPRDVGIEVETMMQEYDSNEVFQHIPKLIEDESSTSELRFRLPSGIDGIISLYQLSQWLIKTQKLNPKSGIHYHIDMTDSIYWDKFDENCSEFTKHFLKKQEWLLKELDKWGYSGHFNTREISTTKRWVRLHKWYHTMEFRIGEMTFDYELLLKRILHCQRLCKMFDNVVKQHKISNEQTFL